MRYLDPPTDAAQASFLAFWTGLWAGEPVERVVPTDAPPTLPALEPTAATVLQRALPAAAVCLLVEMSPSRPVLAFEEGRRVRDWRPWRALDRAHHRLHFSRAFVAALWSVWRRGQWPDAPPRTPWTLGEEILWCGSVWRRRTRALGDLPPAAPRSIGPCAFAVWGAGAASPRAYAAPLCIAPEAALLLVALQDRLAEAWAEDERTLYDAARVRLPRAAALAQFRTVVARGLVDLSRRTRRPDVLAPLYRAWAAIFPEGEQRATHIETALQAAARHLRLHERQRVLEEELAGLYAWTEALERREQWATRTTRYDDAYEEARTLLAVSRAVGAHARAEVTAVLRALRGEM